MAESPTVWPMYLLGAVFCAAGVAIMAIQWMSSELWDGHVVALIPFATGVVALRAAFDSHKAVRARAQAAVADRVVRPTVRWGRRAAPVEPPRITHDPFRDPPGSPPIIVATPAAPPAPPIVPGEASDVPTHLT
jgi:hypothetical protein